MSGSLKAFKFGVGAFWFLPRCQPNSVGVFTSREYIDRVEWALYKQATIDVETAYTYYDQNFESVADKSVDWLKEIRNGHQYPLPEFFRLDFLVTVPEDWQKEHIHPYRRLDTIEHPFHVSIVSTFYYPVTFVRIPSNEDAKKLDGVDAVFVVKKYLEDLFTDDPHVAFTSIGPSPFHASIEAVPAVHLDDKEEGIELVRYPQRGYDKFKVMFNEACLKTRGAAYSAIQYAISSDLGFFYRVQASRIEAQRKLDQVETRHKKLSKLSVSGTMVRLAFIRKISALIDESLIGLIEYDGFLKSEISSFELDIEKRDAKGSPLYFKDFVINAIKGYPRNDTQKIYEYVQTVERRQSKWWEISILAAAGLVGGLLGAFIK